MSVLRAILTRSARTLVPALAAAATIAAPFARAVSIVHTNDVMGELEPCGCRNNPQGGLSRKTNFMRGLPDRELIQLDAGDLLFSTDVVPELLAGQTGIQAGFLLRAHELSGLDAAVPGEKDFALGYPAFEKLRKKSAVRFLAANLRKKNGAPAFEGHVVLTRKAADGKPFRVAVIGLVGDQLKWPKELKATSPVAAAKAELARVAKSGPDLVIALTHQGLEKDEALARAVPGIDFIIGGHTQSFLQKPVQIGKTWIFQSSFRNQYVGVIPATRDFQPDSYRLVGLDAGYDSPAQAPSKIDELVREFKLAVAEHNSREETRLAAAATVGPGGASAKHFQTFPRCAECHLKQFDFWRKTPHARAYQTLFEKDQHKNKECLSCHTVGLGEAGGFSDVNRLTEITPPGEDKPKALLADELNSYLKAMHGAKSLKDEVRVRPADSAQPLRQSLGALTRAWTPVQCENCHQPGGDHPFSTGYSRKVESAACLKCHTADRAPEWYSKATGKADESVIQGKRPLITCPAGEADPED